jgi:hypothetical protein
MIRQRLDGTYERVAPRFFWSLADYFTARNMIFDNLARQHPDLSDERLRELADWTTDEAATIFDSAEEAILALREAVAA